MRIKTVEMYCLTVLEYKVKLSADYGLPEASRGRHFLVSFSFLGIASNPWHSLACSGITTSNVMDNRAMSASVIT